MSCVANMVDDIELDLSSELTKWHFYFSARYLHNSHYLLLQTLLSFNWLEGMMTWPNIFIFSAMESPLGIMIKGTFCRVFITIKIISTLVNNQHFLGLSRLTKMKSEPIDPGPDIERVLRTRYQRSASRGSRNTAISKLNSSLFQAISRNKHFKEPEHDKV